MEELNCYTIDFNGKVFPLRNINYKDDFFKEATVVTIGTISLEKELFSDDYHSCYASKEAEAIDNHIIFFVNDNEIKKDDKYLIDVLRANIK